MPTRLHHCLTAAALTATACPPPVTDLGPDSTGEREPSGGPGTTTTPTSGAPPTTSTTSSTALTDDPASETTTGTTAGLSTSEAGSSDTGTSAPDTSTSTGDPVCGDGTPDPGEACDDGNLDAGDGCGPDCQLEPGATVSTLDLPALTDEAMTTFTLVPKQFLDNTSDALAIGGDLDDFGPALQFGAHVWQVPLPAAQPAQWSYAEYADIYDRLIFQVTTAANGDVLAAGIISKEQVKPDSGGYLWLARFTPTGALVWSHELPGLNVAASALLETSSGNIIVSGHCFGYCGGAMVLAFDPDGALLWQDNSPQGMDFGTTYAGATLDAADRIYVVGTRFGIDFHHLLLRAYTPGGGLLWERITPSPSAPRFNVGDIILLGDDTLVLAMTQYDAIDVPNELPAMGLAAFDTQGNSLWWNQWTPPAPGSMRPGPMLVSADGGFYVGGALTVDFLPTGSALARFDADGDELWSTVDADIKIPRDLLLGADSQLYVLRSERIDVVVP